jgi:hypothetical protein
MLAESTKLEAACIGKIGDGMRLHRQKNAQVVSMSSTGDGGMDSRFEEPILMSELCRLVDNSAVTAYFGQRMGQVLSGPRSPRPIPQMGGFGQKPAFEPPYRGRMRRRCRRQVFHNSLRRVGVS